MEILRLEHNSLTTIPPTCIQLTKLRVLSLQSNPWDFPEEERKDITTLFRYIAMSSNLSQAEENNQAIDNLVPKSHHVKLSLPSKNVGPASRRPKAKSTKI